MTDLIERLRMRQRQGWIHRPGETPHLGAYRPDPDCTETADEIERLTSNGPMMERGHNGDGSVWMGTMRECLADALSSADAEAKEVTRLTATNKLLRDSNVHWAAEVERLTAERDALAEAHSSLFTLCKRLTTERDEYQRAADKLAAENKVLRDAATAYADAQERMTETCGKTDGSWDISVDQYYAAKKQLLLAVAAVRGTT